MFQDFSPERLQQLVDGSRIVSFEANEYDGKNCCGINGMAKMESTNSANVAGMVIHLAVRARDRKRRYMRSTKPGSDEAACFGALRMAMQSSGANTTATNHGYDQSMLTTANKEKVYSPAELWAKPIGTKPAMVTSVPASMAKA